MKIKPLGVRNPTRLINKQSFSKTFHTIGGGLSLLSPYLDFTFSYLRTISCKNVTTTVVGSEMS